jgi:hypothetical protein
MAAGYDFFLGKPAKKVYALRLPYLDQRTTLQNIVFLV